MLPPSKYFLTDLTHDSSDSMSNETSAYSRHFTLTTEY